MIKNWLTRQSAKFQTWLDRPLEQSRLERDRAKLEPDHPRPWQTDTSPTLGRLDPVLQLPRTPLRQEDTRFAYAKIRGESRRVSLETLAMLRAMDQVFLEGASQALDWMQVRVDRRVARNQLVAERQGAQMFDSRARDINQMTEAEAIEFVAEQQAAIIARARHASDPTSANTTQFSLVTA